ncbi:MAG: hypothetical protein II429_09895 [Prevotella sp.]|nr:hypothetical protein [Prevotella sp.]
MKTMKYIYKRWAGSLCCGAAAALALVSCSDWDDHYDADGIARYAECHHLAEY